MLRDRTISWALALAAETFLKTYGLKSHFQGMGYDEDSGNISEPSGFGQHVHAGNLSGRFDCVRRDFTHEVI